MKVVLCSDLHIGVKKSDPTFLESQFNFLEQMFESAIEQGIEKIFILGDLFDTRREIDVYALQRAVEFFTRHENDPVQITASLGNHDLYFKNSLRVHSLSVFQNIKNFVIVDKPTMVLPDTLMIPWVLDQDYLESECYPLQSKRLFAHVPIRSFKVNSVTASDEGFCPEDLLCRWSYIYSGHFHLPSQKSYGDKRIAYLGAPYQMTIDDAREGSPRGFWVLDLENESLTLVENRVSMRYLLLDYPDEPSLELLENKIVVVFVKWADSQNSQELSEYTKYINSARLPYPAEFRYLNAEEEELIVSDSPDDSQYTLLNLAKECVDNLKQTTSAERNSIWEEFKRRYEEFE